MTTAVVAHHDAVAAHCVRAILETGGVPVRATCQGGAQVVAACGDTPPDVVVVSIDLDDGPLHHHIAAILRTGARIVVLCDEAADAGAREALLAGASGCVPLRDSDAAQLSDAVNTVAAGQAALHPSVAASVLAQWRSAQHRTDTSEPALTRRESEVLRTICEGMTTTAAARSLGIAAKTVEAHKARLFAKLGARNQAEAVAAATRRGLLAAP